MKTPRLALYGVVFALIAFGIGYPTLNRYDPRSAPGLSDARDYAALVEGTASDRPESHRKYRILVPALARPVAEAARGRIGSWDPTVFSLLVVSSLLVSAAGVLLVRIAEVAGHTRTVGLVAALLLLSSAVTANSMLAGLVDAAELCTLAALVRVLLADCWAAVPLLALAALGKETTGLFVPAVAGVWWLSGARKSGTRPLGWIAAAAVIGVTVPSFARRFVGGSWTWPWQIALGVRAGTSFGPELTRELTDHTLLLAFGLLLPLGLWRLGRLPRPWVLSAATTAGLALLLGAWAGSGPNVVRPLFSVAGPLLCLSGAMVLVGQGGQRGRGS